MASPPASSCCSKALIRSSRWCCHWAWSCWVRVRLVIVGSSPSSPSQKGKQTCFPQGKSDKDGGERRQGHGRRKPDVFIGAERKPLRRRGRRPLSMSRAATPPCMPCACQRAGQRGGYPDGCEPGGSLLR